MAAAGTRAGDAQSEAQGLGRERLRGRHRLSRSRKRSGRGKVSCHLSRMLPVGLPRLRCGARDAEARGKVRGRQGLDFLLLWGTGVPLSHPWDRRRAGQAAQSCACTS